MIFQRTVLECVFIKKKLTTTEPHAYTEITPEEDFINQRRIS